MAKRKRLTPAQPGYLEGPAPEVKAMRAGALPAPIAQVAAEASASAALEELSAAMQAARREGRLIETLPLESIDARHMVRDRLVQDEDEMQALIASLEARGQQTPIEVVALPAPRNGCTHGLISGWRRLSALGRLHQRTGEPRFATVKALVIAPDSAAAAYVAMVEENEIRADLSFYERARIALRACQEGVYPSQRAALQGLFGSATRSRRSKIGSFVPLVEALDGMLGFPAAISEKLGLALSKALQSDPGLAAAIGARLRADPPATAAEELAHLAAVLGRKPKRAQGATSAGPVAARFDAATGRIELTGDGVDATLFAALEAWLKAR